MDSTHFVLVATIGDRFVNIVGSYASEARALEGAAAYIAASPLRANWHPVDSDGAGAWACPTASGEARHARHIEIFATQHAA